MQGKERWRGFRDLLTDGLESMFDAHGKDWLRIGLSNQPADRKPAEGAIGLLKYIQVCSTLNVSRLDPVFFPRPTKSGRPEEFPPPCDLFLGSLQGNSSILNSPAKLNSTANKSEP